VALVRRLYEYTLKQLRTLVVAVVGTTVLVAGLIMILTPGPAMIVIPIGIAILSTEFVWARRLLKKAKKYARKRKLFSQADDQKPGRPADE